MWCLLTAVSLCNLNRGKRSAVLDRYNRQQKLNKPGNEQSINSTENVTEINHNIASKFIAGKKQFSLHYSCVLYLSFSHLFLCIARYIFYLQAKCIEIG